MNSSKTPRFTESELESLRLWSMPDVSGADPVKESEIVLLDDEPAAILTVDEIESMQKQAYEEAFAQGNTQGFQKGLEEGLKKGYEDSLHLVQGQVATLVSLMEALSQPFELLDQEVENELVKLAIAIAAQIIILHTLHQSNGLSFTRYIKKLTTAQMQEAQAQK